MWSFRANAVNPNARDAVRFWAKVAVGTPEDCWNWIAYKNKWGYGGFQMHGTMKLMAHRVAYVLVNGEPPLGMCLDHLCGNRACCNPSHLEPVTVQDNLSRGRSGNHEKAKTHCPQGHEYTPENTTWEVGKHGRRTKRKCRSCNRARLRNKKLLMRSQKPSEGSGNGST